jgi:hypothetical protein
MVPYVMEKIILVFQELQLMEKLHAKQEQLVAHLSQMEKHATE